MKRRDFIKKLSLTVPASMTLTSLLASCERKSPVDPSSSRGKVIIVGAGAAGLYVANLLNQQSLDVTVVEASSQYGGRIKPLEGFSDFPIELGAEEIHGDKSAWYNMIRSTGAPLRTAALDNWYTLDGQLKNESAIANDSDFKAAQNLIAAIKSYAGPDITVEQYIQQQGISSRVHHILNAQIGNAHFASNSRISIKGMAKKLQLWAAGDGHFMLKGRSLLSVLEESFRGILNKVVLNTQVRKIDYTGATIELTDQNGKKHTADKVIVTVPLTILRDGDISFAPALPAAKTDAFSKMGVGNSVKIILKFNQRFWPENAGSLYGAGYVPQFWPTGAGRSNQNNVLTAFVNGEKAEFLSRQGSGAIPIVLSELDAMFGPGVASGALADHFIMDWSKLPNIQGSHSFPITGSEGSQEQIAAPVANKVFFAGEATNYNGHSGTVHGAMESGERAANELLRSV